MRIQAIEGKMKKWLILLNHGIIHMDPCYLRFQHVKKLKLHCRILGVSRFDVLICLQSAFNKELNVKVEILFISERCLRGRKNQASTDSVPYSVCHSNHSAGVVLLFGWHSK
jgi:hypothetical protein